MNATPFLVEVGRALTAVSLDAVLIGNAAAALHGAPVTTIDFDFLFRRTPRNLAKLKRFADRIGATVLRPYYPMSDMFRVVRDDGLQVDFMATVHGLRSFEGVRSRSERLEVGGVGLQVAALTDVLKSKRAAGRDRDRAVRRLRLAALRRESARALDEQIRRLIALPPSARTNFLRVRRRGRPGSYA